MYKKAICFLILPLLCAWIWAFPPQAHAVADGTTLRVAIPTPAGAADEQTSSAYIGYTTDYIHELSQYIGWQYEVVTVSGDYVNGLRDALNMLRAGEVDLVAPVVLGSEDAETEIYYSQSSFLTTTVELQVPNAVYDGEKLKDTVRVAVLKGSGMQAAADAFFARNKISPQYIQCRNVAEQIDLVCSGQADVMLNSTLEHIPDLSVIARFAPQELYFAASDPALMEELDQANTNIMQSNVLFAQELYEKYVINNNEMLTLEETNFIRQADPYTVAILDNNGPYQDADDETGVFEGIGVDLLRYVAENTGLQFEFLRVQSWDELQGLMEEGRVQIVASIPHNRDLAAEKNLTLTRDYATSPYVLVSRRSFAGPDSGQRLALTEEANFVSGGYYIGDVQPYATVRECLEAVRKGDADYTYTDLYTARYYLEDSHFNGLEFKSQSYAPHMVCFGIARPAEAELLSILNKSINQLSDTDIQQFISQNVNPNRQLTVLRVILDYPLQALLAICAVSLMIASLLILLLWRKEQTRRVLHQKAMEDGLTHLYNAAACRKLVTQKLQQMEPDQIGAFLIMDMDNFKQVNDGFGHQEGDRVLREFADLLRDILREDSVIARIGGDEFVAFLPSVKEEENIRSICSRIRKQAHFIAAGERPLTISIGTVVAKAADDYDTLYRLSDGALYQVKKQTKDQFCFAERTS